MSTPRIVVRYRGAEVAEVVLSGELDLAIAEKLEQSLTDLIPRCTTLVVNTADVGFLDSSTIRVLVGTETKARVEGVRFALILVDGSVVAQTLAVAGVLERLHPAHSLEGAVGDHPESA